MTSEQPGEPVTSNDEEKDAQATLKYHLLGPSLTKAGQDKVDQSKVRSLIRAALAFLTRYQVSEIIYNASKGSKFFNREEERDKELTQKIDQILSRKRELEKRDLTRDLRNSDRLIAEFELSRDLSQHIVHIDCDAFYASVELLERPELKDVPFAVGAGVLTTCNYVARQYGCRSGMAGFVAKKLCPKLILLKPNFTKYTAKAHEVREVLAEYDPRFESASIDEAYLNITEYCAENNVDAAEAVDQMRREIHQKTHITVSAGIAANSKLAKICSNFNKPNGQYQLTNDRNAILAFMRTLPTRKVNGIGRVLERELLEIGVKTCGDLYAQRQYLYQLFGEKTFEFLLQCHLGLGRTRIQPAEEYERKSVGTESTFREMSGKDNFRERLRWTAEELEKDMRRAECKGRTLCLKIKLHTFEVFTRQVVTPRAICLTEDLYTYALPMLAKLEQDMPGMKLRLMGLRCTHLVSTKRPDTMAFFGFKTRKGDAEDQGDTSNVKLKEEDSAVEDQWEQWPDEEFHDRDDTDLALDHNTQQPRSPPSGQSTQTPYRHHGKEITPNPKRKSDSAAAAAGEEWWDCPICQRPQAADERLFNGHIDLCLSRQTIRDAVQADGPDVAAARRGSATPEPSKPRAGEKKRGRPGAAVDPKQKRLRFG